MFVFFVVHLKCLGRVLRSWYHFCAIFRKKSEALIFGLQPLPLSLFEQSSYIDNIRVKLSCRYTEQIADCLTF